MGTWINSCVRVECNKRDKRAYGGLIDEREIVSFEVWRGRGRGFNDFFRDDCVKLPSTRSYQVANHSHLHWEREGFEPLMIYFTSYSHFIWSFAIYINAHTIHTRWLFLYTNCYLSTVYMSIVFYIILYKYEYCILYPR